MNNIEAINKIKAGYKVRHNSWCEQDCIYEEKKQRLGLSIYGDIDDAGELQDILYDLIYKTNGWEIMDLQIEINSYFLGEDNKVYKCVCFHVVEGYDEDLYILIEVREDNEVNSGLYLDGGVSITDGMPNMKKRTNTK